MTSGKTIDDIFRKMKTVFQGIEDEPGFDEEHIRGSQHRIKNGGGGGVSGSVQGKNSAVGKISCRGRGANVCGNAGSHRKR